MKPINPHNIKTGTVIVLLLLIVTLSCVTPIQISATSAKSDTLITTTETDTGSAPITSAETTTPCNTTAESGSTDDTSESESTENSEDTVPQTAVKEENPNLTLIYLIFSTVASLCVGAIIILANPTEKEKS